MPQMKQVIADTLTELLRTTTLENITVKDIASRCGVSRQAFYYYFDDIYDVLEWVFVQETERALNEHSAIDNWQEGYVRILRWAQEHKTLVRNTYNSVRREYVEYFMNRVLFQYIMQVVSKEATGLCVPQEQQEFIAQFYTLALNAISLEWIRNNMKEEPEHVAKKVSILLEGSFQRALHNFQDREL